MQVNIDSRLDEIGDQFGQYVSAYARELDDDTPYGAWLVMGGVVAEHVADWEVVIRDRTGRVRIVGPFYDDATPVGTAILVTGTLRRANGTPCLDADYVERWESVVADGPQRFDYLLSVCESYRASDEQYREDQLAAFDALMHGLDRRPYAALMAWWRKACVCAPVTRLLEATA